MYTSKSSAHTKLGSSLTKEKMLLVLAAFFILMLIYVLFFGTSPDEIPRTKDARLLKCLLTNGTVVATDRRFGAASRYASLTHATQAEGRKNWIVYKPLGGWGHQILTFASLFEFSILTGRKLVVDIPYYPFFFRSPFGFPINLDNNDILGVETKKYIEISSDAQFRNYADKFSKSKDYQKTFPEQLLTIRSSYSLEGLIHENVDKKGELETFLGVELRSRTAMSYIIQMFTANQVDLLQSEVKSYESQIEWEKYTIRVGIHMKWKYGHNNEHTMTQKEFESFITAVKGIVVGLHEKYGVGKESTLLFLTSDVREQKIHLKTYLSQLGKCEFRETKEVNTEKETDPYMVLQPLTDWIVLGDVDYMVHMGSPFATSAGMRGDVVTFQYSVSDGACKRVPLDKYVL